MQRAWLAVVAAVMLAGLLVAAEPKKSAGAKKSAAPKVAEGPAPRFQKIVLEPLAPPEPKSAKEWAQPGYRCEGCAVFDVDKDGQLDVVAGGWWYPGPGFKEKYAIRDLPQQGEFCNNYGDFGVDVNGDGWTDVITGGWFSRDIAWFENPKGSKGGKWERHLIDDLSKYKPADAKPDAKLQNLFIEALILADLDGDKQLDLLPNTSGAVVFYRVKPGAEKQFTRVDVGPVGGGHGVGAGDLNGDGRPDVITPSGWYESPQDPMHDPWTWHKEFNLGHAGIPIQVYDVNGDGLADIVYGQGHDYGVDWLEQRKKSDGGREWVKHPIDYSFSQSHSWAFVPDLLGDGRPGFLTGKRIRGHGDGDPGSFDPRCIYWYTIDRSGTEPKFVRHTISYGEDAATGMQIQVADLDRDGHLDIVVPGKSGLYIFKGLPQK